MKTTRLSALLQVIILFPSTARAVGAQVMISGGSVGERFGAFSGSTVTISGGTVGDFFSARGAVTISGGTVGDEFTADHSTVTISGGSFGEVFNASEGSEIHLLGREFLLDGLRLQELVNPGDSLILETREGRRLTGTLFDGNSFDFDLYGSKTLGDDFFDPTATLRLTLAVPKPSGWALACLASRTSLVYSCLRRFRGHRSSYVRFSMAKWLLLIFWSPDWDSWFRRGFMKR